jgi:excisionase family DNA binding protein
MQRGGERVTFAATVAAGAPADEPLLLDVKAVAALLGCSSRNVYRLADAGKMPRPLKVGTLVRWRRADIETWIANGCPATPRPHRE